MVSCKKGGRKMKKINNFKKVAKATKIESKSDCGGTPSNSCGGY